MMLPTSPQRRTAGLQLRRAISIQAAFRFLAAFFFSYSACRLSISLFGTEIKLFASFSKRWYSSEGGLTGFVFFILRRFLLYLLRTCRRVDCPVRLVPPVQYRRFLSS